MFNIHVHNDDTSFYYTFLEGQAKKGSDSVVSFLYDCLSKTKDKYPNIKKIVLLSDAAGGQNKNATVMMFVHGMHVPSVYSLHKCFLSGATVLVNVTETLV